MPKLRSRPENGGGFEKRLQSAQKALDLQGSRLDVSLVRLREKENRYQREIAHTLANRRRDKAILFANELVQVRKAIRSIQQARSATEQIALRLGTIREVGDLTSGLGLASNVLDTVKTELGGIASLAEVELNAMADLTTSFMLEVGPSEELDLDFSATNDDAEKILKMAKRDAERSSREASSSSSLP